MNDCTCPWVDPKFWTTHMGAIEPGSTQEYDPTCPVHGALRNEVERLQASVARVEAALDIETRARAWMRYVGYEDYTIDKAEAWRQPLEPWLHDDPPQYVIDLEFAADFAREYEEVIRAALKGDA